MRTITYAVLPSDFEQTDTTRVFMLQSNYPITKAIQFSTSDKMKNLHISPNVVAKFKIKPRRAIA
ncbi:MAG TPA: hypothetical protein VD794_07440 [Flavisolibacter sp.]|nr:hypothetical protein [Flavisolibacter sp.]